MRWREWRGRDDPARRLERLGCAGRPRPAGPVVWMHGASIGEGLALTGLALAQQAQGFVPLLTTGTAASAAVLPARLSPGAVHQMAPLDLPSALARFLDHWRPCALVLAESEIWPNTILACSERDIPIALVNARLSERSFARWRRTPRAAPQLFGRLALCLAQTDADAARFAALGAKSVSVAGNLKLDLPPPPADSAAVAQWRAAIGTRPVLAFTSMHREEEDLFLRTHHALRQTVPALFSILIPRDVFRGETLSRRAQALGISHVVRSTARGIGPQTELLVADTVGEMGLWLRLADVAVIGKTFAHRGGGQSPIEAAKLGAAIVHGPSVFQFGSLFADLDEAGAALRFDDPDALLRGLPNLFSDPDRRRATAARAAEFVVGKAGAAARTLDALAPLLARAARAA